MADNAFILSAPVQADILANGAHGDIVLAVVRDGDKGLSVEFYGLNSVRHNFTYVFQFMVAAKWAAGFNYRT